MSKCIMINEEVYSRLKVKTNNFGGRSPKKVSFSTVIESALNDQDRLKKRKINKTIHDSSRMENSY